MYAPTRLKAFPTMLVCVWVQVYHHHHHHHHYYYYYLLLTSGKLDLSVELANRAIAIHENLIPPYINGGVAYQRRG